MIVDDAAWKASDHLFLKLNCDDSLISYFSNYI